MAVVTRTRVYEFRASHRLDGPPAPEVPHGHTYRVEVTTEAISPARVDAVVEDLVVGALHGRAVTITPATGENIVEWIDARLRSSAIGPGLRAVCLRETGKNRFVSARSEARHV